MSKGMAHPGFFYIDRKEVIREKFFEARELERFTPNNVIGNLFPEILEAVGPEVEAPHLRVQLAQSDRTVTLGNRVTLAVEVELPPRVHVYAPDVQGYKPIQLILQSSPVLTLGPVSYTRARILYLKAIREKVPVFEGKFRLTQDVTVTTDREFARSVGNGMTMSVGGELYYQACDEKICYPPNSVPVTWQLNISPLDRQRSPEDIRHK